MEEMNTIEMQAQESAAGTAGYAESTAPAGPEAPQGDLGGADNEGTGARRQTPEENARFAAMRRRQEAQQREERLFHELVGDARNPETGMPFASKAEFVAWRDGAAGRGRAQAAPVEPEALARLEAQLRQQFRATDPEFLAQAAELKKAHDREAQAQFSNDLKTIRAAYPDEKAQKVEECALPGFVDSKNEEKTERNAGYLVVSHSGGGMLRQGTRKGIRRTPANRGMRAHRIVKSLDISEDVCHGLCP